MTQSNATASMVHFSGGPLDGHVTLWAAGHRPAVIKHEHNTDGWYEMRYQVAGEMLPPNGALKLTVDDAIAQWHQRNASHDFTVGDKIVVEHTGATGVISGGPLTANGDVGRWWLVRLDDNDDVQSILCDEDDLKIA